MEGILQRPDKKMIMKKYIVAALLLSISLYSCKKGKEDKIARKWQAQELNSPQMDKMLAEQQAFIDTFGKNTDAATNMARYNTADIDSLRHAMQAEVDDFKAMQQHAVTNTWFDIRKNGLAIMNFSGQIDSANWYFDEEGALILDQMKLKGTGSKIVMEIVSLEDTLMKLRFTENGVTSAVSFKPEK
jgi:uncharacterized protein with NAD-binding domain and iron-sulfur cluster